MIYKGPSIYKIGGGGGGGGYVDGGELVDAYFIKIDNNTISSYNNISRTSINFYFEPSDGEILDAIVNLSTTINSAVNVYIKKNGYYYSLGIIGSNVINAGDSYTVTILGNSYSVDQVTNFSNDPDYIYIPDGINSNNIYKVSKIDTLYWTDDVKFGKPSVLRNFANGVHDGWRLPTYSDWNKLKNAVNNDVTTLKSTNGWNNIQGSNATGFNAYPYGYYSYVNSQWYNIGQLYCMLVDNSNPGAQIKESSFDITNVGSNDSWGLYLRLCKDVV